MNRPYRDMFVARAHGAVVAARSVANVSHSGLKGHMRELLIRELFRPLLPADVGVGTGQVITVHDQQSSEQDVVIFDRRILPPMVLESSTGLFPVESVLFTVEVKSRLTAAELRSAHESALQWRQFHGMSGKFDTSGQPVVGIFIPPAATVFALDSDLAIDSTPEAERYDRLRGSATSEPALHMLCVVGRGTWIWGATGWNHVPATPDLAEIAAFVATILNSYRDIAMSRATPRIGYYLSDVPFKSPGTPSSS
jgi:hypothetical protein